MENFSELIRRRRSTRKFTGESLNPGEVELILRAALMAPSSKNKEPWRFIVVEEKETLRRLAACKASGAAFLAECALAVVVTADVMTSEAWIEDASIASIYMQLQAEDLGLGSCWCQVRGRETEEGTDSGEYVRRLLDIPYQLEVLSVVGFGHKARERAPRDEASLRWENVYIGKYTSPEEASGE